MKKILQLAMLATLPFGVGAQTTYNVEQFNTGNGLRLSGTSFAPFVFFEETSCGEVKIKVNKDTTAIGTNKPMVFTPRNTCGSSQGPFDMTGNIKVHVRMRGAEGLPIRIRLTNPDSDKIGTEFTLTKNYEFEEFTFDFTQALVDNQGVEGTFDPTMVERVFFDFDRRVEGFKGDSLYIDYIVLGDLPSDIDKSACISGVDVFGAGMSYFVEDFDGDEPAIGGEGSDTVTITQKEGVLTVKEKEGLTLREFKPIVLSLPTSYNVSETPKVIVKAKPFGGDMTLRIDLVDTSGLSTNACTGRVTKTFKSDQSSTIEFGFQDIAFEDINGNVVVDKMNIKRLNFFFLGSDGLSFDSVHFEVVSLGELVGETGIFTTESNKLALYPNPAQGTFQVNAEEAGQLTIANQYGQVLNTYKVASGATEIDINNLENGFYIVTQETTSGKKFTTSLIKQ